MAVAVIVLVLTFFKEALQALSNELGLEIRIAHYPPYTSKYNPIETSLVSLM